MAKLIYMLFCREIDLNQDLMCSNNTVLTGTVLDEKATTFFFFIPISHAVSDWRLVFSNLFQGKNISGSKIIKTPIREPNHYFGSFLICSALRLNIQYYA